MSRPAVPNTEPAYERGDIVRLRGKTLRGKNRINRGGHFWVVAAAHPKWGVFLESCDAGSRECFWATLPNDQHVATVEECEDHLRGGEASERPA